MLSIHVLFNTNPVILEKIVSSELYLNTICLLDSPDIELQEMALKMYTLFYMSARLQKKKENIVAKLKHLFKLIKKVVNQHDHPVSAQFCQAILYMTSPNLGQLQFLLPPN